MAGRTEQQPPRPVAIHQYTHYRARRTLKGIDEQIAKAEQAVAGKTAVKRNRFVELTDATKIVNREWKTKAPAIVSLLPHPQRAGGRPPPGRGSWPNLLDELVE